MPRATSNSPETDTPNSRSTRYTCITGGIPKPPTNRNQHARSQQLWTAQGVITLLRQLETRLSTLRRLDSEAGTRGMPMETLKRPTSQDQTRPDKKRRRLTYSVKRSHFKGARRSPQIKTTQNTVRILGDIKACKAWSPADAPQHLTLSRHDEIQRGGSREERSHDIEIAPDTRLQHVINDLHALRDGSGRRRHIYKGILEWLNGVLRATEFAGTEAHPKSLVAMCLRRIPACINEIEAWERTGRLDHDTEHSLPRGGSDAQFEIYEQLGAFGNALSGWIPLKYAVRAHGIWILKRAVLSELIDPSFVQLMVRLCTLHGCSDEAAQLATAVPGRLPPPRNMNSSIDESSKLQPLGALIASSIYASRGQGVAFRSVSELIKERRLPSSWIATEVFYPILSSAIEAIGKGSCSFVATELLKTVLTVFTDKKRKKPESGEQQVIITVAAELLTSITAQGCSPTTESNRRTRRRLSNALESCLQAVQERAGNEDSKIFALCMAHFLANDSTESERGTIEKYLKKSISEPVSPGDKDRCALRRKYLQTLGLVCPVVIARSCGQLEPGLEFLATIYGQLADMSLPCWFLHRLKRDCCLLLEQWTGDGWDPDIYKRFRQSISWRSMGGNLNGQRSLWLWEEGLEEWISRSAGSHATAADLKQLDSRADKVTDRTRTQELDSRQTSMKPGSIAGQGNPANAEPDCGHNISTSGNRSALGYKAGRTAPIGKPAKTTEVSEVYEGQDVVSGSVRTAVTHEVQGQDQVQKQGRGMEFKAMTECAGSSGKEGQLQKRAKTGLPGGLKTVLAVKSEPAEAKTTAESKSAAAAPIGGRRQLFVVRGQQVRGAARGPGRPGHDAHWLPW